jgi:excisionase family DNA binding protein
MAKPGRKPLVITEEWQQDLNGWMTIPQAANYKGCTAKAIHKKIDRGTIKPRRFGSTLLVAKSDIDDWKLNEKMQTGIKNALQQKRAEMQAIRSALHLDKPKEEEAVLTAVPQRRSPFD